MTISYFGTKAHQIEYLGLLIPPPNCSNLSASPDWAVARRPFEEQNIANTLASIGHITYELLPTRDSELYKLENHSVTLPSNHHET